MPLPLYILGASIITGIAMSNANKRAVEVHRQRGLGESNVGSPSVRTSPSSYIKDRSNLIKVKPEAGSVVCCEVFHELDHTGIWIDENCIIEFSNSGLVKAVSFERFTKNRSGNTVYVASNHRGESLAICNIAEKAVNSVFTYDNYDLLRNNCHSFVARCLEVEEQVITFADLNMVLLAKYSCDIYWDEVEV